MASGVMTHCPPFRFCFDEVVRVVGSEAEITPIRGELGVVVGRADDASHPLYGVWIYSLQEVWSIEEIALESEGRLDPPPSPDHAIRVAVDEHGRGHVVGVRQLDR